MSEASNHAFIRCFVETPQSPQTKFIKMLKTLPNKCNPGNDSSPRELPPPNILDFLPDLLHPCFIHGDVIQQDKAT